MIKVSVMYPNTPGARFDHSYYKDKHMPMCQNKFGAACTHYTVDRDIAAERPVRRLLTSPCATSSSIP
jgi:uncharacterized protein (TIGR02118 family)